MTASSINSSLNLSANTSLDNISSNVSVNVSSNSTGNFSSDLTDNISSDTSSRSSSSNFSVNLSDDTVSSNDSIKNLSSVSESLVIVDGECVSSCDLPVVSNLSLEVVVSGNSSFTLSGVSSSVISDSSVPVDRSLSLVRNFSDARVGVGGSVRLDLHDYFVVSDDVLFDVPVVHGADLDIVDNRYLVISPVGVDPFDVFVYATDGDSLVRSNTFSVFPESLPPGLSKFATNVSGDDLMLDIG
ncbi:MAG: hypothetical protein ACQESE_02070, partial [Nanobdellota archaeon]